MFSDEDNANVQKAQELVDKATNALAALGYHQAPDGEFRQPSMAKAFAGDPTFKATGTDSGAFILAVSQARSRDASEQAIGKATLNSLSTSYLRQEDTPAKATLGTTDATGGWITPNAIVEDIVKPVLGTTSTYRQLISVRTGVQTAQVEIPFRSANVSRAVIAQWGDLKENSGLAYNGYTATMYTLARIYDVARQFVRTSAGAAQQDVLTELAKAFGLGQDYYVRDGAGSTEPFGFVPALTNGPSTFRTSHTPAASTLAGSVAAAIAKAAAALMARGRKPEAVVMSADGFLEMVTNGDPAGAGFFVAGTGGPRDLPAFRPGTLVSPWGIPVLVDPNFASDDMVVAEWSAFKLYEGPGFRVDTSDEAGERWDRNLIGYRGELEIAFDARPAVYAGAAQLVTNILA